MVQVYADGVLIYDPRLPSYSLLGLTAEVGVEKGGTAEIVMPPGHPAYNSFVSYRTIVEIYRNGELTFRGRALYPTDDFYNRRTITCEGERCFLRDAVVQPYLYQASPESIFVDVITRYNAQVDSYKQFRIGAVTAKDPNDYQRIESESASLVSDVIDKLLEYVGGYIVFTTDPDGQRVINWYGTLDNDCGQAIEFGENLLDFSSTGANTELATVIFPYGAKNEETGERVTIKAVNDGKLYIMDEEAVALRGWIAKAVYWDDVTLARNLLTKAKKYLATSKLIVTSLELSAVDLSAVDINIDSLRVGCNIRVLSRPHGVDGVFMLTSRSYDFLNPGQDSIVLGKDMLTLTGSDVSSNRNALNQLERARQSIKTDYVIKITDAINTVLGSSGLSAE